MNSSLLSPQEAAALKGPLLIGQWKYICVDGVPTYLYADAVMDELIGVDHNSSPEQRHELFGTRVYEADRDILGDYTAKMQQSPTEVEYRYLHPKLGLRMVRCTGTRHICEDGTVELMGIHQDVTDIIRLRYQASENERALSHLTRRIYGFNIILDLLSGEYTLIEGTGMEHEVEILRKHVDYNIAIELILQNVHPAHIEKVSKYLSLANLKSHVCSEGFTGSIEFPIHHPGMDRYEWHEMTVFIETNAQGLNMVNILSRNITDAHDKAVTKAQLEIANASNEAKTKFLFNMSHDIRTPMNAIIGFTNLLEKHIDDPKVALDYLHKIQTSNDFLLSLINNVLEMARIESGKSSLEMEKCNLMEFNDMIYAVFGSQMAQKGITLNITPEVKHMDLYCDITKLKQIFLNIMSNALKYTPKGGTVSVNTVELPSDRDDYIILKTTISDTGQGMSKDFLPHLFDEFAREQTSTESQIIGTGLGMSIVKRLIELMEGTIEVESELGKGTTFTITLLHKVAEDTNASKQESNTCAPKDSLFEGKRILMAEDNELNAEIAITILEEMGFEIDHAHDGKECVEMLTKADSNYYDLILMDIQMPHMNGYEATRAIRQMESAAKANIPIVAMTANAFKEDKENAFHSGMNGHLAKPIEVPKLMQTLEEMLR